MYTKAIFANSVQLFTKHKQVLVQGHKFGAAKKRQTY